MADDRINVTVRIRPQSETELADRESLAVERLDERSLTLRDYNGAIKSEYDGVFGMDASNEDVFGAAVQPMLTQALEGKNATLFAYGQTGSGKTYTIEGMMARAADFVFAAIKETPDREFLLKLSAVEVYNEVVHDLQQSSHERMELVDTGSGKLVVKNLREEPLASALQLRKRLKRVRENRRVRYCYRAEPQRVHTPARHLKPVCPCCIVWCCHPAVHITRVAE